MVKKPAKKKVAKAPKKAGVVSKDAGKQLAATTAAKKSHIKASGLIAHVRGHVVASGQRHKVSAIHAGNALESALQKILCQ